VLILVVGTCRLRETSCIFLELAEAVRYLEHFCDRVSCEGIELGSVGSCARGLEVSCWLGV
jgi:hypothetical protein